MNQLTGNETVVTVREIFAQTTQCATKTITVCSYEMALKYLPDHYEVVSVLMGMCNTPPSSGRVCGKIQPRQFPWVKTVRCLYWKIKLFYSNHGKCSRTDLTSMNYEIFRHHGRVSKYTIPSNRRPCYAAYPCRCPFFQMALISRPWCVFVFRAQAPMKTRERLKMPSLLSKRSKGLCAFVLVSVFMCCHRFKELQRESE